MKQAKRTAFAVLAGVALVTLVACGKNSNPAAPSTVAAAVAAPPPAPVSTVLVQSSFSGLEAGFVLPVVFTTGVTGDLESTVDWTFATDDVDMALVAGANPCTLADLNNGTCPFLGLAASATAKPERLTVRNQGARTYTLYIANFGPETESLSFQVLLTSTPGTRGLGPSEAGAAVRSPGFSSKRALKGLAR